MGSISILRRKQLISSLLNNASSFASTSNKSHWSGSMMSCIAGDNKIIPQQSTTQFFKNVLRSFSTGAVDDQAMKEEMQRELLHLDINQQIGSCMPLRAMRIGTIIHNIELKPGQGGKLVRAAGTSAKILKEPGLEGCVVRLPSGSEKVIDSCCRATVGVVSNLSHKTRKLGKAGRSRWLGRRPVVRGVAMNPVDHPHGGGEGRSKSSGSFGRVSQTPWGKPTKSGYKTSALRRKK